jgi:acetyl esterase/lipase
VPEQDILIRLPAGADRRLTYGSDPNQFVDVRVPRSKGPHPVVFFIHGGFWRAKYDLGHTGHLCDALKKTGIASWNVEYRRVGNSGGGWPGTFEDIRAAYHLLLRSAKEHGSQFNPTRICVAGHSAGGHLALCLAAFEKSVTRAISLAGVLDLRRAWDLHLSNDAVVEFLGGTPTDVPENYRESSPIAREIPRTRQVVIHGTADTEVPYEISKSYVETKKKSGEHVELITLQDVGHFEIVDPVSAVWPKIQESIQKALSV